MSHEQRCKTLRGSKRSLCEHTRLASASIQLFVPIGHVKNGSFSPRPSHDGISFSRRLSPLKRSSQPELYPSSGESRCFLFSTFN
jgi:hypothetical protein